MKFSSLALALLPAAAGFAPSFRGGGASMTTKINKNNKPAFTTSSTSTFLYVDPAWFDKPSKSSNDDDKEEETTSSSLTAVSEDASSSSSKEKEDTVKCVDPAVGRLMEKLSLSETTVYGEYYKWCMEFTKKPSTDRYEVFKLNFLLQQDYGHETGEFFNLNEFGDCTEEEFLAIMDAKENAVASTDVQNLEELDSLQTAFDATVTVFEEDVKAAKKKQEEEDKTTTSIQLEEDIEIVEAPPSTSSTVLYTDIIFSNKVIADNFPTPLVTSWEEEQPIEAGPIDLRDKYAHIEDLNDKAYQVIKDLGWLNEEEDAMEESTEEDKAIPAAKKTSAVVEPLDENFSFLNVPKLVVDVPYMEYLKTKTNSLTGNDHEKNLKIMNYANSLQSQTALQGGKHSILSFADQIHARVTFTKGKKFSQSSRLNATTSYLEQICDLLGPYLKHKEAMSQPNKPAGVEQQLQDRYAAIENLGDRAFQVLVDLCMASDSGKCSKQDL